MKPKMIALLSRAEMATGYSLVSLGVDVGSLGLQVGALTGKLNLAVG